MEKKSLCLGTNMNSSASSRFKSSDFIISISRSIKLQNPKIEIIRNKYTPEKEK